MYTQSHSQISRFSDFFGDTIKSSEGILAKSNTLNYKLLCKGADGTEPNPMELKAQQSPISRYPELNPSCWCAFGWIDIVFNAPWSKSVIRIYPDIGLCDCVEMEWWSPCWAEIWLSFWGCKVTMFWLKRRNEVNVSNMFHRVVQLLSGVNMMWIHVILIEYVVRRIPNQ